VIDVSPLLGSEERARAEAGEAIGAACRSLGFFYAKGHAVSAGTLDKLASASRTFFALCVAGKVRIGRGPGWRGSAGMFPVGGRAWRGFFPVGGELTSGKPDIKEGVYFGEELPASDPRVRAGLPLHGANLWPESVPELRPAVMAFMEEATRSAHAIMEGVAL